MSYTVPVCINNNKYGNSILQASCWQTGIKSRLCIVIARCLFWFSIPWWHLHFYTSFRNKSLCLILYSWHTLLWFMLCLHRITIYRYKTTITLTAYIIWWFIVNKGKWNEVLGSQIDLLHRICNNELFFFWVPPKTNVCSIKLFSLYIFQNIRVHKSKA